jgi:hypothetical protein
VAHVLPRRVGYLAWIRFLSLPLSQNEVLHHSQRIKNNDLYKVSSRKGHNSPKTISIRPIHQKWLSAKVNMILIFQPAVLAVLQREEQLHLLLATRELQLCRR